MEGELAALAGRIARMPAASVAAVKRVLNASLAGLDAALVTESDELGRLLASGGHVAPMRRFLDAGGQTREGETTQMAGVPSLNVPWGFNSGSYEKWYHLGSYKIWYERKSHAPSRRPVSRRPPRISKRGSNDVRMAALSPRGAGGSSLPGARTEIRE
jgi:hypothetical protein